MNILLIGLIDIADIVLTLYTWVIIISVILSWLVAFDVINARNTFVYTVGDITYRMTEPVYRPIRSMMPNLGGIDLTPMVVLLIILFIQTSLFRFLRLQLA